MVVLMTFKASEKVHIEMVKYLVKNGSNINEKNKHGYIPLHRSEKILIIIF